MQSQDALLLLLYSFAIPKMLYILRTARCFLSFEFKVCDNLLRNNLSSIVSVSMTSEPAWLQASLPVRAGVIGTRRAAQLAPFACLASAAGCSELIHNINLLRLHNISDPHTEAALACWSEHHDHLPPNAPESRLQRVWDSIRVGVTYQNLSTEPTVRSSPSGSHMPRIWCVA